MKVLRFLVLGCLVLTPLLGYSGYAYAGLSNCLINSDTPTNFGSVCDWNIEEADSWEYSSAYWYSYFGISTQDSGSTWDVTYKWQHKDSGHGESAGPLQTYSFSFSESEVGNQLDYVEEKDHDYPHVDYWHGFFRHIDSDSSINMSIGHVIVPEPISSILFVTGGTLLAGRRYIKRKIKS